MPFTKGNKLSKGGQIGNKGGRPSSYKTELKNLAIKEANDEAEKSLRFCVTVRNDDLVLMGIRLAAAQEIMDRVWGKPKQVNEMNVDLQGRLILVRSIDALRA